MWDANNQYVKISEVEKIIDKAAEQQKISRPAAEAIIYQIYKLNDPAKFKKPQTERSEEKWNQLK